MLVDTDLALPAVRCALPIYILASSLAEEARLASAGSRNLLFGESGVLAHSDVPQVDLPSYQDHVMDRVANMETASYFSHAAGFTPTLWSGFSTPMGTPIAGSPMTSPPPSRPASPGRHFSAPVVATLGSNASRPAHISGTSYVSRHSSGTNTPVLASPSMDMGDHPEAHRNWIDSELMGTLNLDHTSPPGSNPTSRPSSRPGSQPNSRPASPSHGTSTNFGHPLEPPSLVRATTTGSSFFSLHLPKPLRPLTAFSRMGSSSSVHQVSSPGGSTAHHPSPSALSSALAAHAARASPLVRAGSSADIHHHSAMSNHSPTGPSTTSSPTSTSPVVTTSFLNPIMHSHEVGSASPARSPTSAEEQVDFLSQVPSYSVAARGFLGGGVVPLSTLLPNYEDSEDPAHP